MLETQKKAIAICDALLKELNTLNMAQVLTEKASALKADAAEQEMLVPVIGEFSAGKSAMLNACIGEKILSEAVTPETSLATELHYSIEEYAEAIKEDDLAVRYEIQDLPRLSKDAALYKYAKLYLKHDALKEIEPLVLVDMPGFNSPLDRHNKAICVYLERGTYYIVLGSVEDGTIKDSLLRHLREIINFDRKFSFFLSKANLRPADTVRELAAHYETILQDRLDLDIKVMPIGNTSGGEVVSKIKTIDTEELFYSIYKTPLKALCFEIIKTINLRIAALKQDAGQNKKLVNEMEASIAKIQAKADSLTKEVEERYSESAINDILNEVGRALDSAVEELLAVAMSGNQEELSYRINEIVRVALTGAFKNELDEAAKQITRDFSFELRDLNVLLKDYEAPDIVEMFENKLQTIAPELGVELDAAPSAKKMTRGMEVAIGVVSLITDGVMTATEAVITFLPELLTPVFQKIQQNKIKNELRRKLQLEIFPDIRQRLRRELPAEINKSVSKLIDNIKCQYQEKIDVMRQEAAQTVAEAQNNAQEAEKQIALFTAALQNIKRLAEGI